MRRIHARLLGASLAGALAITAATTTSLPEACAQATTPSPTDRARAKDLYRQGTERFQSGDFRAAVDLFEQAQRLDPHPVLAYNVARAHENLGELDEAIAAYRRYLELDPKASDRGAVEQRITTLQSQRDERRALEQRTRELKAAQQTAAAAKRSQQRPPPDPPSPIPWLIAGVGAVGIGIGATLGALATGIRDDAQADPSGEKAQELEDDSATLATAANITLIAGGALLLGGVIIGVIDVANSGSKTPNSAQRPRRLTLGAAPTSLLLRGQF
jgi:tetratricopeptide (TPR) repeat protein